MNPSSIHPRIIEAVKTGMLMDDEQVHAIIRTGHIIFATQEFLNRVANDHTNVHVKAALDFIERFLGNYQYAEISISTNAGREHRLSYFGISQKGRDGYCIVCSRSEIYVARITSIDGMATLRRVMQQQIS